MDDVTTNYYAAVNGVAAGYSEHARKRPLRPANAEIRPDCGLRLVVTTPTAYSGFHAAVSGYSFAATVLSSASVAESYDEHPPKRQQQAANAKAPEITPFTSQAP